ncbi:chromatin assembly factor 1 subunit A isoform X1 [Mastomys coucha]|uniref:chromatin assembly factor 1 subunit A isoform X1 n=2 Tax=Mastomys coucha TaxID=35658 RepID=UPI00126166C9|nr:chromatin assembly factor 1 subunit A isoform X1 [Mastomys coucha]XP_031204537.1 chromatin assembly factor 1 subunit A isoform X1 [Mastomys coucha]
MLEEPEAATRRAAAMDCKDRPGFPVKRLIQARLPFKRLNLVPKEKVEEDTSAKAAVEGQAPDLRLSLGTFESQCHTGSHVGFSTKLVSGQGPIDSFLRATIKPVPSVVIVDLTENSSDIPDSPEGHSELSPDTAGVVTTVEGAAKQQEHSAAELCLLETPSDITCHMEEESGSPGGPKRTGDCQAGSLQSCPELPPGSRTCSTKELSSWSKAGDLLFIEKVPVVVLEDILATKPSTASLPMMALDRSVTSESEMLESCPEDDSILSHSSINSSSPTSSPEGLSIPREHGGGRSPHSTPICRVAKNLVKGSTEKSRSKLHRDREQQREEKEKLREEMRRAKEEARRKKEEEKELKEKERREKREKDEKEKAEKQRLKEERRKERQEALEAKLEEKRKKEEEKRLREEEKRIKAEKAEITRFFQKPKTPQAPKTLAGSCGKFAPFEIKEHMVLAPRSRAALDQDLCDQLDQLLQQQSVASSFLSDLKSRLPLRLGPTQVCGHDTDMDRDVVIVESSKVDGVPERKKFGRMKLLQFSENHRPAYWGTWNKKTAVIRPRNPWAQDKNLLDYEVDSDDEWEEEEPGESLSHSEGDEDDDVGEDEDEDDGFFVPHGYLSEDEGVTEECADPENHKVRQKLKAKEWDELLAKGKRFRVLQPVQVGCVWAAEAANCTGSDLKLLQQFTACLLDVASPDEPEPRASRREKRDQHILAQLLPLLHGNVNGSKVIIREFQEQCRRGLLSLPSPTPHLQMPSLEDAVAVPSKARLKRLISENSAYEKRPDFRMCWYVHPQVLRSFGQECLPVPCQWTYITAMPSAPREDSGNVSTEGPGQSTPMSLKRKPAATMCITQFMKKRRYDGQVGSGDMDGFQADTEEDEEDDTDCMVIDVPDVGRDISEAPIPAPTLCK